MFDLARFDLALFQDGAARAAALLKLLGNEKRLMVLCQLSDGELSVGQLQSRVDLSQSALSQHLALLRDQGVVATRREGQTIHYRISDPAALRVIATLTTLAPAEVAARLRAGKAVLVDIREADEFARNHIAGARNVPLATFQQAHLAIDPAQDVIFTCRSGMRTGANCDRLAARVIGPAYVLEGGVDGWAKSGLPVATNAKAPLEIIRQVQIATGSLVLLGVILGFAVAPGFFGLSAFVGAGLVFAGISGTCAMASLLGAMPWNKRTA